MLKEFKEFISKGNVMDLAVGVIIGGAFGLIVSSLVDDSIMPIVGAIFGGLDAGRFDVIANQVSINPERQEKYLFSSPYTVSRGVVVTTEDDSSGDPITANDM